MPLQPAHEIVWTPQVRAPFDAVRFINHVGFCVLFPVNRVPLPSLYYAVAKRLPAKWDKHAQLVWRWRDLLSLRRLALYVSYFRSRATFFSLDFVPYFLAAREGAPSMGSADSCYSSGRISHNAFALWSALAGHGGLPTLELRHICKMETTAGNVRFKKAIVELQRHLIVCHSGGQQETRAWASNRLDLISSVFPEQVRAAQKIPADDARRALAVHYRTQHPAASITQIARLFAWTKAQAVTAAAL